MPVHAQASKEGATPSVAQGTQTPKPQISDPAPEGTPIDQNDVFANYLTASGSGMRAGFEVDCKLLNILVLRAPAEPSTLSDTPAQ